MEEETLEKWDARGESFLLPQSFLRSTTLAPKVVLEHVVERLQRAFSTANDRTFVEVPEEDVPRSKFSTTHAVPLKEPGNCATAVLLFKQFESLSRKDVLIEESEVRSYVAFALANALVSRCSRDKERVLREKLLIVEDCCSKIDRVQNSAARTLIELETACRRRVDQLQEECNTRILLELSRTFTAIEQQQFQHSTSWAALEEERERHQLNLEADRGFSRLFGQQISESQHLTVQSLLRKSRYVPSEAPSIRSFTNDQSSPLNARQQELVPTLPPQEAPALVQKFVDDAENDENESPHRRASCSRNHGGLSLEFEPNYGWMFKSTGVLMTWQRRFFVLTKSGKLKCTSQDPLHGKQNVRWVTVFSAEDILRVEVDSLSDGMHGAKPPSDMHCFYVDVGDSKNEAARPHRVRFCCANRQELNQWLQSFRRATDVVYQMEEDGRIQKSPLRIHFSVSEVDTHHSTYRRRLHLVDSVAAQEIPKVAPMRRENEKHVSEKYQSKK